MRNAIAGMIDSGALLGRKGDGGRLEGYWNLSMAIREGDEEVAGMVGRVRGWELDIMKVSYMLCLFLFDCSERVRRNIIISIEVEGKTRGIFFRMMVSKLILYILFFLCSILLPSCCVRSFTVLSSFSVTILPAFLTLPSTFPVWNSATVRCRTRNGTSSSTTTPFSSIPPSS